MAKRYAAQALAEWFEKQIENRKGIPYPETLEDWYNGNGAEPSVVDNRVEVPVKLLNELLREHKEIQARKEQRKQYMKD